MQVSELLKLYRNNPEKKGEDKIREMTLSEHKYFSKELFRYLRDTTELLPAYSIKAIVYYMEMVPDRTCMVALFSVFLYNAGKNDNRKENLLGMHSMFNLSKLHVWANTHGGDATKINERMQKFTRPLYAEIGVNH